MEVKTEQTVKGDWLAWIAGLVVTPLAKGKTEQEAKDNLAFVTKQTL